MRPGVIPGSFQALTFAFPPRTTSSDDEDVESTASAASLKKSSDDNSSSTDTSSPSVGKKLNESSSSVDSKDKPARAKKKGKRQKSKGSNPRSPKVTRAQIAQANAHSGMRALHFLSQPSQPASPKRCECVFVEPEEEVDYSSMGTMQINTTSTVEVKNTSELFFQHVADMKLREAMRAVRSVSPVFHFLESIRLSHTRVCELVGGILHK